MVSPGHTHSSLWCIHEKEKVVLRRNEWNQKPENVQTTWTLERMTYFSHSLRGVGPGNLAHLVSISVSSVLLWPPSICQHPANLERAWGCGVMGQPQAMLPEDTLGCFYAALGFQGLWDVDLKENSWAHCSLDPAPGEGRMSTHSLWLPSDLAALLQTITQPQSLVRYLLVTTRWHCRLK